MLNFNPTELIPHRGPMLWVLGILEADIEQGFIIAQAQCTTNHLLYNENLQGVEPSAAVEIMAQTIGLLSGYTDTMLRRPLAKTGKLLSIKRFDTFVNALPINTFFQVEAKCVLVSPPIGVYECKLFAGEELLANAEITAIREDA